MTWMLGIAPAHSGVLRCYGDTADSTTVLTTAVMADIPVLVQMLTRLFESTAYGCTRGCYF
jgi:hypothetical protein